MLTVDDIILIRRLIEEAEHEYKYEPYDRIPWAEDDPDAVEKEVLRRFNLAKKGKKK